MDQEFGEGTAGMAWRCFMIIWDLSWEELNSRGWLLELSGSFFTHRSDTWPGMPWRLTQWDSQLEHLHAGPKRECPKREHFKKTSVCPRESGGSCMDICDQPTEIPAHHFQHTLLVKTITSPLRFKGRGLRTSYLPPLWGMSSHCRRTHGVGEDFAAENTISQGSWKMWDGKNTQSSGKKWYMNRLSQYNKVNFKVVISLSRNAAIRIAFPFDKSHHIYIFSFIFCLPMILDSPNIEFPAVSPHNRYSVNIYWKSGWVKCYSRGVAERLWEYRK